MEKKKWYRNPGIKGFLLILQYILMGGAIFCGLFFLTLEFHGVRLSDSGETYADSKSFANTFYNATWDVAHALGSVFPYVDDNTFSQTQSSQSTNDTPTDASINNTSTNDHSATGNDTAKNQAIPSSQSANTNTASTDSTRVIDLEEVVNNSEISFTNTSGLAYSFADLQEWVNKQDYYDNPSGKPIVICHVASSSSDSTVLPYHYYYAEDFLKLVGNGDLTLALNPDIYGFAADLVDDEETTDNYNETDSEMETTILTDIKEYVRQGILYKNDYDACVKSKDGTTIYDSFYNYTGYQLNEDYAPQDAGSLLDVLNSNVQWNGRLEDAFDGIYEILSRIESYNKQAQVLDTYVPGKSNMRYLYINEDTGHVLTDDETLQAELDYNQTRSVTFDTSSGTATASSIDYSQKLQDLLNENGEALYVLIQSKPGGFSTNLTSLNKHSLRPMMDITADAWKETISEVLPEVNDNFIFAAYVDRNFSVSDTFGNEISFFEAYSGYQKPVFFFFLLCLVLLFVSFIWLTAVAGRNNQDAGVQLCFFDHWPTEFSAGLVLLAWFPVVALILQNLNLASYQIDRLQNSGFLLDAYQLLKLMISGLYTLFWFQIGYLSLVRRIKAKKIWKNSILRWLLRFTWKVIQKIVQKTRALIDFYSRNTAAKVKVTVAFVGYVFFKYLICGPLFGRMVFLFFINCAIDLLLFFFGITKASHQEQITRGLKEISSGNLQYKIPLDRLSGEDKIIAEYINNIGSGLDAAVENSLKNERMKTELITNVSHDLKTPLTSIISYIDLLKRENFTDPKVQEYLNILEQKAARLKVLTEDVVEASKASTGNLTLNMTDLDFIELLHQVIGEFEERFEEHHLTMMVHFADEPSIIHADGQRMWRVLENIFGNVIKYAMEGTRVYAEVQNSKNQVIFSLKNISAQPLNFAAEELTERFVRGDVARNTEGSGLGLSIAKSFTELQGGKFQLYLDGDLFKVTITFKAENKKKSKLPTETASKNVPIQVKPDKR